MNAKAFLVFFLFAVVTFQCTAQVKQGPGNNSLDDKYTPARSSIFNLNNKARNPGDGTIEIKNVVKFSPTLLIRQKIGFFYERAFGKSISAMVGVGKAFAKDFMETQGMNAFSFRNNTLGDDLHPGIMIKYCDYISSSPFFTAALRIFYLGETFDGAYLGLSYTRERMDYQLTSDVSSYPVEGSRNASFTMNAFNFGMGFEFVSGKKQNFIHDFYFGLGFKNYSCAEYKIYQVNSANGSTRAYMQTGSEVQIRVAPCMNLSYAVGFGF